MKSVGEVMAIAARSRIVAKGIARPRSRRRRSRRKTSDPEVLETELGDPGPERIWYVADAFRYGLSFEQIQGDTHIDPWFLAQIEDLVRQEQELKGKRLEDVDARALLTLKRNGFSDRRLAKLLDSTERKLRSAAMRSR